MLRKLLGHEFSDWGRSKRPGLGAGLVLIFGLTLWAESSYAQRLGYPGACKLPDMGGGVFTGTPWSPAQVGNVTSGAKVLAARTLSLMSDYATERDVSSGPDPYLVYGGRLTGPQTYLTYEEIPTNVPGVAIRIGTISGDRWLSTAHAVQAYHERLSDSTGGINTFGPTGHTLVMELVTTGEPIPPGKHEVHDLESDFVNTMLEIKMVGKIGSTLPGTDISSFNGVIQGNSRACNVTKKYDFRTLIRMDGGGPTVTAICEVDARYVGHGREVRMAPVSISDFSTVGSHAGNVSFDISLSNCAKDASPKVSFYSGPQGLVPTSPNVLRLERSQADYARNLGIALTEQGGSTRLVIGANEGAAATFYSFPGTPTVAGATATYGLEAHYVRTDHDSAENSAIPPGVTAGPANSVLRFRIRYD